MFGLSVNQKTESIKKKSSGAVREEETKQTQLENPLN
jgi:hypothetical protein